MKQNKQRPNRLAVFSWLLSLWSRENLYALILCLIIILLIIATADSAPQWIYQNF